MVNSNWREAVRLPILLPDPSCQSPAYLQISHYREMLVVEECNILFQHYCWRVRVMFQTHSVIVTGRCWTYRRFLERLSSIIIIVKDHPQVQNSPLICHLVSLDQLLLAANQYHHRPPNLGYLRTTSNSLELRNESSLTGAGRYPTINFIFKS